MRNVAKKVAAERKTKGTEGNHDLLRFFSAESSFSYISKIGWCTYMVTLLNRGFREWGAEGNLGNMGVFRS